MQTIYSRLLGISPHIENPDYYELLGIKEVALPQQLENAYQNKMQKLQRLGNNPKYKEIILYLKGELRNAYSTLSNPTGKTEYDLSLLARRVEILEREHALLSMKGPLVQQEIDYLRKRGRELKIPLVRIERVIRKAPSQGMNLLKHCLEGTLRSKMFILAAIFSFASLIGLVLFFRMQADYFFKQLRKTEKELFLTQTELHQIKLSKPRETVVEGKEVPSSAPLPGMVYVPSGYFMIGSKDGNEDERPMRKIYLDAYYIKQHEVTQKEYREFVKESDYSVPYSFKKEAIHFNWDPLNREYPKGMDNYPVVLVSWHNAMDYCKWLSRKLNRDVSLPTESQWEKAAKGAEEYLYPWGNLAPEDGGKYRANFAAGIHGEQDGFAYLAPVGSFPEGKSFFGCFDMAGNVWEWCKDSYDKMAYRQISPRNPIILKDETTWPWKVLRGGSWGDSEIFIRTTYRFSATSDQSDIRWGFRYVVNLPSGS